MRAAQVAYVVFRVGKHISNTHTFNPDNNCLLWKLLPAWTKARKFFFKCHLERLQLRNEISKCWQGRANGKVVLLFLTLRDSLSNNARVSPYCGSRWRSMRGGGRHWRIRCPVLAQAERVRVWYVAVTRLRCGWLSRGHTLFITDDGRGQVNTRTTASDR